MRAFQAIVLFAVMTVVAIAFAAASSASAPASTHKLGPRPCKKCQLTPAPAPAKSAAPSLLTSLWDTSGFPPRWYCGTWSARLGWLHIVSDLAIWLAYLAIPCVLACLLRKRKDMPFPRLLWLFVAFIVACGTTHLIEAIIFWWPAYRMAGVIKLATAIVSWTTVVVMIPQFPKAMSLRSPQILEREVVQRTADLRQSQAALQRANEDLEHEVMKRTRDLRRTQKALKRSNERLEHKILNRTCELEAQAEELRAQRTAALNMMDDAERSRFEAERAEKELARTHSEMAQFFYTISHDLKSPLVTIRGFVGCIQDDFANGKPEQLGDFLRRILTAVDRMTRLIDDLLQLSRAGVVSNEPQAVAMNDLIRDVVSQHELVIAEVNADVEIQVDSLVLNVDPIRFTEVIDNLLVNALKYGCDNEHPRILIGAEHVGGEIRIFVRDWGKGVPQEYQDRIFDMFQRLHTDGKGTGIGLAMVKRIVERHKGRVWVESSTGQGATFWIVLPECVIAEASVSTV